MAVDANFYLSQNSDVLAAVAANKIPSAEFHYQHFGQFEGRNPNAFFNTNGYLVANQDVLAAIQANAANGVFGLDPLTHYLNFGINEGRQPSADYSFDPAFYATNNPDLAAAGITSNADLFMHFVNHGASEGRAPASGETPPIITSGKTFTLTNQTDLVTGTSGNDIIIGDAGSTQAGDTIIGSGGMDELQLFGLGATGPEPNHSGVEIITVNGNTAAFAAGVFDVSDNPDVTKLNIVNPFDASNFTIGQGDDVLIKNVAAGETVDLLGTNTSLNLTLDNVAATGADANIDLNSTSQTSVDIKTMTTASQITLLNTGAKVATVNISGDQALEFGSALTTITTIDASKNTKSVNIDAIAASNLTFTGTAGNDTLNAGATITSKDVFDFGAGTGDKLIVSDADTVDTAAEVAGISNFEIFDANATDGTTYNLGLFGAKNTLTGLIVSGDGATTTVSGINDATVGNITINADAPTVVLTATNFVSGGTSDTATVNVDNSVTKNANGVDVTLTFANADVLNVVSKGDGTSTKTVGGAEENSLALTATDAEKIVITGDEALALTTAAGTVPTEIDASGVTNSAAVNVNTNASAIASILVKGTGASDTIVIDNAATTTSTLFLNGGSDTVTVDGGGTSSHTLIYTADALNSGDMKAGNASTVTPTGVAAGDVITINLSAAMEALLNNSGFNLASAVANINLHGTAISATNNIAAAQAGGNMVLQIDLNGDGTFTAANDWQITLVGTGTDDTLVYNTTTDTIVFTVV